MSIIRGQYTRLRSIMLFVATVSSISTACAADLRLLDSVGLVRATRVIKDRARITITLQPGRQGESAVRQTCTLSNLDGVAKEQQVTTDSRGICEFRDITPGAWEISVASGVRWSVAINE